MKISGTPPVYPPHPVEPRVQPQALERRGGGKKHSHREATVTEERYSLAKISPENAQTLLESSFMKKEFNNSGNETNLAKLKSALGKVAARQAPNKDDLDILTVASSIIDDARDFFSDLNLLAGFDRLARSMGKPRGPMRG